MHPYRFTNSGSWGDVHMPPDSPTMQADSTEDLYQELAVNHQQPIANLHTYGAHQNPLSAFYPALGPPFDSSQRCTVNFTTDSTETITPHTVRPQIAPTSSLRNMHPSPAYQESNLYADSPRLDDATAPFFEPQGQSPEETVDYFRRASGTSGTSGTSASDNYWKQEYDLLCNELSNCQRRLIEEQAHCRALQLTITDLQREQRVAAGAPPLGHFNSTVVSQPASMTSRTRHRSNTTITPNANSQRNPLAARNTSIGTSQGILGNLEVGSTPTMMSYAQSQNFSVSPTSSRIRFDTQSQQNPSYAENSRQSSVQNAIAAFRTSFTMEQANIPPTPSPTATGSRGTAQRQASGSTSYRRPNLSGARSRSEGLLALRGVADEQEKLASPFLSEPLSPTNG